MSKSVNDAVLDAAFNEVKNNATFMTVCSQEPTTRDEAIITYALADIAVTGTDFTIGDGVTSGRKMQIAAKNNVPIDASGTATHIAIVDNTRLLYVTTCTSQPLISGNEVNFPAWNAEIADPT